MTTSEAPISIGPYSFEAFLERVKDFHGFPAPGVILGGIMVEAARRQIPSGVLFNAISETNKCLPDAIQLLTPCTIGNGWLKVYSFDRFALSLYDKDTGKGVRVILDIDRMEAWPEIKTWYFKLKSKDEVELSDLLDSIARGGEALCSVRPVQLRPVLLEKVKRGPRAVCPRCREGYPANDQGLCLACQGQSPYL
jgi:formylmethanofuran dehydrogenase subunit E